MDVLTNLVVVITSQYRHVPNSSNCMPQTYTVLYVNESSIKVGKIQRKKLLVYLIIYSITI